ncbi:TetR/AcrR family transcriptional regulator [Microbacterium terricola]|uniref:TetR family transcriptional regulator n=1 Tax=Microbacterium terricola TaxID=344163 RepID=A0ABM8DVB9_9MICO|nr:TetR/AcrR family transcriptional regulator [Microbacterium terricola]UYK39789.1 TetR/AcrR family transcriptional regulator [Microbacterium terricola]BDV29460.1 TetR family transcriptional regulator [Microbacterium terricola]
MTAERKRNRGPSAGPENRRALIAAARVVFAEDGYRAPLSRIAKRAGVGQGSLYRHFPDRKSLALAVFDENLTELELVVADQARTLDDLLGRVIEQTVEHSALLEFAMLERDDREVGGMDERFRAIVDVAVQHEQATGRLAAGVTTADVTLSVSLIAALVSRSPADERRDLALRSWRLLQTGLGSR